MLFPHTANITLDNIEFPILLEKNIRMKMLRLDKIHPVISGNKWFKLKYHLENFEKGNYKGLLTFGGAWSNHLVAVACACFLKKIKSAGIIRGERPKILSDTLQQALHYKMELFFISRKFYREKNKPDLQENILLDYPGYYIVPEGGSGIEGEKGAGETLQLVNLPEFTHIICAVGTGTMLRGLAKTALPVQHLIGVPVLKGWKEKSEEGRITFETGYHFGGYAKKDDTLIRFMNDFYKHTGIPTDFVYTGKMAYAAIDLANNNFFRAGSNVLLIHSGGLQGNASLTKGSLIF